ncbi:hypothetical protein B4U80_05792 [Leptotrombidium deliense]|uniref:Uncharacterized protein n=1 Tax=Leptotrombidium deliense TaxID=299467 RepID=A0A443S6I1_9ACAR|nr:hypothetical protein B4U80_05792 [Leptotrombidium deliense]
MVRSSILLRHFLSLLE